MSKSKIIFAVIALALITHPPLAQAGVPDLSESEAFIAYPGPGVPSLLVVPDGTGNPFTAAHDEQGNEVDATITLFVRDGLGTPIFLYPFEDMWLHSVDGGLVPCIGGATADHSTDQDGRTEWVNPLFAAGSSEALVQVMINGDAVTKTPAMPLKFNSPDLNADGIVNLTDVAILSGDYYTGYTFRCDLNGDGALNLADVPIFAAHYGAICP